MRAYIHKYQSASNRRNPSARRFALRATLSLAIIALAACAGDGITGGPQDPPPPAAVATVAVDPSAGALLAGETVQLRATAKDRDGRQVEGRIFAWSTSDAAVAEVSATGLVTTKSPGTVRISASSEGKRGEATLTVSAIPAARVVVAPGAVTLEWNGETTLAAQVLDASDRPLPGRLVAWTSSDPTIAEVDATGRVVAKGTGVVTVWAIAEQRSGAAEVRVLPPPVARVVLPAGPLSLDVGESATLAVRLEDALGRELTGRTVTWSSSNQQAAFVSAEGRVSALAVGNATIAATSEGVSATIQASVLARPAYDLIYHRYKEPSTAEIFVLGLGTSGIAPERMNAGTVSRDPSPSPDGQRFAFAVAQVNPTTGQWMHDLYVVNRNGMNVVWLTRDAEWEIEPAWSPDGSRIAYTKLDISTGARDVWVVNVDGSGAVNLTAAMGEGNASSEYSPAWSPDGSRIAFVVTRLGVGARIWTMNADGSDAKPLAIDEGYDTHPTWSADGTRLAFVRVGGASGGMGTGGDIAIASVTGGAVTRLEIAGEQLAPEWSPAGDYIAFVQRGADARNQIYTMRPDGTGVRLRTTDASWGGGDQPSWIKR